MLISILLIMGKFNQLNLLNSDCNASIMEHLDKRMLINIVCALLIWVKFN